MGRADYLDEGSWNAMCSRCGKKFKMSALRKHWQGMMRCPTCWEPRQAQDFVRAIPDVQTPPWVQPWPTPGYLGVCSFRDRTAIAGVGEAGCAVAGYEFPNWQDQPTD